MKQLTNILLLGCLLFLCLSGCQQPTQTTGEWVGRKPRLKITDLEPVDHIPLEVQCVFSAVVYHIPPDKVESIPNTFSMLSRKAVKFDDADGFSANHLWTAAGTQTLGPELVKVLGQLEAERKIIKKFILFQDYPEEIAGLPIEIGQSIFYFRGDGSLVGRQVPGGRLSLVLRAWPDTPRKGFARMVIEPVFRPASPVLPSQSKDSLLQPIIFDEGRIQAEMAEGDFLVLAATGIQENSGIFSRLFVDFQAREPTALIFVIVCLQAGAL